MPVWLVVLIAVAACAVLIGVLWVGRKNPSAALRDQLRTTDPRLAETIDQLPATARAPRALPIHDRSFDRPR
jgi:hypothetical protein